MTGHEFTDVFLQTLGSLSVLNSAVALYLIRSRKLHDWQKPLKEGILIAILVSFMVAFLTTTHN